MTAVKLRVQYISRTVRGRPGQTIDLDDAAARRLISRGRATRAAGRPTPQAGRPTPTRAGARPTPTPAPETEAGSSTSTSTKPKRSSRAKKPPTEDRFLNPDADSGQVDLSGGRTSIPPD